MDIPEDPVELLIAADHGDVEAQFLVGYGYFNGEVFSRSPEKAAEWWRKAAELGFAPAQNNLGGLYYEGIGVVRDYLKAEAWWRKAAEQGDTMAKDNLAQMLPRHSE